MAAPVDQRALLAALGLEVPLDVIRPHRSTVEEADGTVEGDEAKLIERRVVEWARRTPPALFVPPPRATRRLLVVDGCSVGRAACGLGREKVNCLGLLCVVRLLIARNFDVVVFIPGVYNNDLNQNVAFSSVLPKLQTMGLLGFTASRTAVSTRRRPQMNYDELYVLELAERHGGAVLSGDFFEDVRDDPRHVQFRDLLRRRSLGVRFHPFGEALVHVDDDVFFRCVPELALGPHEAADVERTAGRLFVAPDAAEWPRAANRRRSSWSRERQTHLLDAIDRVIAEVTAPLNLDVLRFRSGLPSGLVLCDDWLEKGTTDVSVPPPVRMPSFPLPPFHLPPPPLPARPFSRPSFVPDLTRPPPPLPPFCPPPRSSSTGANSLPLGRSAPLPFGHRSSSPRPESPPFSRPPPSVAPRAPAVQLAAPPPSRLSPAIARRWNENTPPLRTPADPRCARVDLRRSTPEEILRMFGVV
ncbi:RNase NYN domain-containing protein [Aphelenchoides fujianensis]|nr:RNase NYN domain-containing protein [Aphelenchoides fujianensis]